MIQIANNNGTTQLESMLVVTPEVLRALRAMPPKRMQSLCDDLEVAHRIDEKKDSDPVSVVGMIISERANVKEMCETISQRHRELLKTVEEFSEKEVKENDKKEFEPCPIVKIALGLLLIGDGLMDVNEELCK